MPDIVCQIMKISLKYVRNVYYKLYKKGAYHIKLYFYCFSAYLFCWWNYFLSDDSKAASKGER